MKPVFEMPDDPIPQPKAELAKDRIEDCIKRDDESLLYVVPDLPADATTRGENADALTNDSCLLLDVCVEVQSLFILLADIIWR